MNNREIEAKFLEIDKGTLIQKLKELGAVDLGEDFLREVIFYDGEGKWIAEGKTFVRIREIRPTSTSPFPSPSLGEGRIKLTYKNLEAPTATGTEEIEFGVLDAGKAQTFLEKLGLRLHHVQEKKRRSFKLAEVSVDIDTWPRVPTYVELEGPSEEAIKQAATTLGFDWAKAIFANSRMVLEQYYKIPVGKLKYFTFDRVE